MSCCLVKMKSGEGRRPEPGSTHTLVCLSYISGLAIWSLLHVMFFPTSSFLDISCTDELDATVIPFSVFGYHAGAVLNYTCLVGYQRDTIRPSVCVWMSGSFQWFPLVTCSGEVRLSVVGCTFLLLWAFVFCRLMIALFYACIHGLNDLITWS